jgi:hypothetical protein
MSARQPASADPARVSQQPKPSAAGRRDSVISPATPPLVGQKHDLCMTPAGRLMDLF